MAFDIRRFDDFREDNALTKSQDYLLKHDQLMHRNTRKSYVSF